MYIYSKPRTVGVAGPDGRHVPRHVVLVIKNGPGSVRTPQLQIVGLRVMDTQWMPEVATTKNVQVITW